MSVIAIEGFSGISPRTSPVLLQNAQAQVAGNVKLQSGEIRAWRSPVLSYQPAGTQLASIYKLIGPGSAFAWLEFAADADVVSGPQADTSDYRVYYTSTAFGPRKTNYNLATTSGAGVKPFPNAYYEMGDPAPVAAPTLSASGGSAPTESRGYVYTLLNTFGSVVEETAPSPAALVTCNTTGMTVSVSGFSGGAAGNYNWTGLRIYRTITGSTTVTYQYVDQLNFVAGVLPASGTSVGGVSYTSSTYPDTQTDSQLSLTTLASTFYTPPPTTLQGLVSMPNGMLAGFTGNQVWFCEPYLPHAWPATYSQSIEFPIVGLGVFGNTLLVTTTKFPYLMTGTTPSTVTVEKLPIPQPCASKRSIASDQWGVVYASPNGLVAIGLGVEDVISSQLYTRDEWQAITPSTMLGILYNNLYIGFSTTGGITTAIVMARQDLPPLTNLSFSATALFAERTTGNIYAVNSVDSNIYQLDADPVNNLSFSWQSKKFIMPEPTNFGVMKLQADWVYINNISAYNAQVAAITASNAAIMAGGTSLLGDFNEVVWNNFQWNGSLLAPVPPFGTARVVQVQLISDNVTVFTTGVTSQEPIRLPAQQKGYVWEVVLTGNSPIREFKMATTVGELKGHTGNPEYPKP